MLKQKLHFRANFTALSMTKKLSKRTVSKQAAEQSAENNQLSVQTPISSKMSKRLAQFFAGESGKTSDSFKIKLEVLTFNEFKPGSLSNQFKADSENKDEISDEIKKVLKIIKKQVKNFIKKQSNFAKILLIILTVLIHLAVLMNLIIDSAKSILNIITAVMK